MSASPALERNLCAALEADDFDGALVAINSVARRLDDDPKAQKVLGVSSIIQSDDRGLAARLIAAHLADRPGQLQAWTKALLAHDQLNVRDIGVMILPDLYPHQRKFVTAQLLRFADDNWWVTRETAGDAAGRILNRHFAEFYPMLERWTQHKSNRKTSAAPSPSPR